MGAVGRSVTLAETVVPTIVVPKGRTAAERRVSAVAALHQPMAVPLRQILAGDPTHRIVCSECRVPDSNGYALRAAWPCATVRLLGPWPGEPLEAVDG